MQSNSCDETSLKPVLAFVVMLAASVGWAGPNVGAQSSEPGGSASPLRMDVGVTPPQVRDGEKFIVRIFLTNTSNTAVGGCARAWEDYIVFGTKGKAVGRRWVDDGVPPESLFLLPPGHTLSWQVTVAPNRLGAGQASLVAELSSDCHRANPFGRGISAWNGTIHSQPVRFAVVE
jgi:hypothetical protein